MHYFKHFVALIIMALIGPGCSDPKVYLVKDGESEFHLQWTEPLKEARMVLFYVTEFNYWGDQTTDSYLELFPAGEFRSRLLDDFPYGLLSVEIPPAAARDTLDRPHAVGDATTKGKVINTVLVGHPYKPYDVGKPFKLTFDCIDVQQIYLEKEYEHSTNSEGKTSDQEYGLYLVWKPGYLRVARYVLVRITPLGKTPEESLIFFPPDTKRVELLHHWIPHPNHLRGEFNQLLRDSKKKLIQTWLESRASVFRQDPEYCTVEILPAEKLNKLELPVTASRVFPETYIGGSLSGSLSVPVNHKFLPYDVGSANTHHGSKVIMSGTR